MYIHSNSNVTVMVLKISSNDTATSCTVAGIMVDMMMISEHLIVRQMPYCGKCGEDVYGLDYRMK